jgi:hypothetical protein
MLPENVAAIAVPGHREFVDRPLLCDDDAALTNPSAVVRRTRGNGHTL